MKKMAKALKAEKNTEESAIMYHVACQGGRMVDKRFDNLYEPDETSSCFVDGDSATHCHHIIIRRTPADSIIVRFQNTKPPKS